MDKVFSIGEFCFRLICDEGIVPPENFMLFEAPQAQPVYTYEIRLASEYPKPRGRLTAGRPDLLVFEENGLEMRFIGVPGGKGYYACYAEIDETHAEVLLEPNAAELAGIDTIFLSLFAMERHQICRDSLVLHCAYMQRGSGAILFSAPSGTGKTTQATLWEKHRGTRVVNGDKSLVRKQDGVWTANGWPVCGSSGVCHNESLPIRAIVMLSQGKENTIQRLTPFQAFSQIYSQITINFWNRQAQQQAMDRIEDLVTCVPVYHLSCTISQEAVKCLEQALDADGQAEAAGE